MTGEIRVAPKIKTHCTERFIRRVAILGPGGVGGTIAALLASHNIDVTCVARPSIAGILHREGLRLDSVMFGRLNTRPRVTLRLEEPVDLLFITTKAYSLDQAVELVDSAAIVDTTIIPLLNGIEHMERLQKLWGDSVLAGSIRIEASMEEPGRIRHRSPFLKIRLASDDPAQQPVLRASSDFLNAHGLETAVAACEAEVLWEKLARMAALACVTAWTNQPLGVIRKHPSLLALLKRALREGVEVACRAGAAMGFESQWAVIESLPETLTTSMQRDVAAGRPSELDAIAGAVIREGRRRGVPCPALEELMSRICGELPPHA